MKKIGILSDTHGYLDPAIYKHFEDRDELWHAGDIGDLALADELAAFKPLRAVYGNIDGHEVRWEYPEDLWFEVEGVKVWMTHIANTPPRYLPRIKEGLVENRPQILVCGHSHILRVEYVKRYGVLHINPGAVGIKGFHKVRTMIRLSIDGDKIFDCEVIEMGERHPRKKA